MDTTITPLHASEGPFVEHPCLVWHELPLSPVMVDSDCSLRCSPATVPQHCVHRRSVVSKAGQCGSLPCSPAPVPQACVPLAQLWLQPVQRFTKRAQAPFLNSSSSSCASTTSASLSSDRFLRSSYTLSMSAAPRPPPPPLLPFWLAAASAPPAGLLAFAAAAPLPSLKPACSPACSHQSCQCLCCVIT